MAKAKMVRSLLVTRFWAIAREKEWPLAQVEALLAQYGISSHRKIPLDCYDVLVGIVSDPDNKSKYTR